MEHQQEKEEIKEKKTFACMHCKKEFPSKFNMIRHEKNTHYNKDKKYMQHEKKGNKYKCKICLELFFPSARLKDHYLKKHTNDELARWNINIKTLARKKPIMKKEKMN